MRTCICEIWIQFKLEVLKSDLIFLKTDWTSEQIIKEEYSKDDFIFKIINLIQIRTWRFKKIFLNKCIIQNDKLYYQNWLVIFDYNELKLKLL